MTEQDQNPAVSEDTDDTEGHGHFRGADDAADDEDTEGHGHFRGADDAADDDDTEGHTRKPG
jgi:hypothetical protein